MYNKPLFPFCSIINLNMQTMLLALSILVVANSSLMSLGDNCLEQYIPDLNKICIRPNYI